MTLDSVVDVVNAGGVFGTTIVLFFFIWRVTKDSSDSAKIVVESALTASEKSIESMQAGMVRMEGEITSLISKQENSERKIDKLSIIDAKYKIATTHLRDRELEVLNQFVERPLWLRPIPKEIADDVLQTNSEVTVVSQVNSPTVIVTHHKVPQTEGQHEDS